MKQMISYQEAKTIVQEYGANLSLKTQIVAVEDAIGLVCAEDIIAPINVQPFDNSAMDGFAVRRLDVQEATQDVPVALTVCQVIAAGDAVPTQAIEARQCAEIMTGAPVPPFADAVVPVERVVKQGDGDKILFVSGVTQGENIRYAGEDFKTGEKIFSKGTRILPQHMMALATLGIARLLVFSPVQAMFLSTGNELVDDLSLDLKSGQIYNSNRPYGLAILKQMGVVCHEVPKLPDDVDGFVTLLKNVMDQGLDFVISSGAVSAGKFDFVREGLEKIGAEILFHKVKMKPGKPNLFARLPNGSLYFGLPGNPIATAAGLRFFVQPCLDAVFGLKTEDAIYATANNGFKKRAGLQVFLKAKLHHGVDGQCSVDIMNGQQSFKTSPFVDMNAWAIAGELDEEIKPGDLIGVYPFYAGLSIV